MNNDIKDSLLERDEVEELQCVQHFFIMFDLYFMDRTYNSGCKFDKGKDTKARVEAIKDKLLPKLMNADRRKTLGSDTKSPYGYCWLDWATFWYYEWFLAPTIFFVEQYETEVLGAFAVAIFGAICYSAQSFLHLHAHTEELGTFEVLKHSPMSALVLLFCSHFICCTFAYFNLKRLRAGKPLLFPLLFCFFVGKWFMIGRMVLAYSSGHMGIALDYFVWQEFILTGCHAVGSYFMVGYPDEDGKNFTRQINTCMLRVVGVDLLKTLVIIGFWLKFKPGVITDLVNRMPDQKSQIVFAVVIHFVLDMVQSLVTFFTIYLGQLGQKCCSKQATSALLS